MCIMMGNYSCLLCAKSGIGNRMDRTGGFSLKKRCLSLLLATILCICMMPAALAAGTEIAVVPSSQTAAVGDTVTVTVEIKGNPGVAAVQFALTYDDSVM